MSEYNFGKAYQVKFIGCKKIKPGDLATDFLINVADAVGAKTLDNSFSKFPNGSVTAFVTLAESHYAIHTWSEQDISVAICTFHTCGNIDSEQAIEKIFKLFEATTAKGSITDHDINEIFEFIIIKKWENLIWQKFKLVRQSDEPD